MEKDVDDEIRARCLILLKDKDLSLGRMFGRGTPAYQNANRQIKNGKAITLDTIINLSSKLPDLSLDWLIRGVGEMCLGTDIKQSVEELKEEANKSVKLIGSLQEQIKLQQRVIDLQEQLLKK